MQSGLPKSMPLVGHASACQPAASRPCAPWWLRLALVVPIQITEPVHFSLEDLVEHRRLKISSWKHLRNTRWLVILSSPLIYLCVLPFLLLDASVALYQFVCFPIYGIPALRRNVWNPAPIDSCPAISWRQRDSDSL
jgi:hypothetical protein